MGRQELSAIDTCISTPAAAMLSPRLDSENIFAIERVSPVRQYSVGIYGSLNRFVAAKGQL